MRYEYFIVTWDVESDQNDDRSLAEILSNLGAEGWRVTQTTSCPGKFRKLNLGYSNADYSRDKYRMTPILTIFLERIMK